MQGLLYRYTNLNKYFEPANNYDPRHTSYSELSANLLLQSYVQKNTKSMEFFSDAIPGGTKVFSRALEQELEKRFVVVHSSTGENMPGNLPFGADFPPSRELDTLLTFDLVNAEAVSTFANRVEYTFRLPPNFPDYLSTCIFTPDRNVIRARHGDNRLVAAQGQLVRPSTFDVQNIATRRLVVALPKTESNGTIKLSYSTPAALKEVWRNEPDNIGFTYVAPRDGWLLVRLPYDNKWRASVDGTPVTTYKANGIHTAFELPTGQHKILLSYWPATNLRGLIGVSVISLFLSLLLCIRWGILLALQEREEADSYPRGRPGGEGSAAHSVG